MAHSQTRAARPAGPKSKPLGLLAQFDDPQSLVAACDRARRAGYKKMDAYSPFPVHGIDPAIGIRRTRLPFFVLAVGLCGCVFALAMQYYANAADYSPLFPGYGFLISGKPLFSVPANIPVTFEVIVLSSAFAAFLGMWALNRLPRFANPLHRIARFRRATNDRFFLLIENADEKFDANRTRQQLEEWGAAAIENVETDMTDQDLPKFLKMAGIVFLFLLLVPPVMIFRSYGMTSRAPRLHVVPDMDWQDKYQAQQLSPNLGTAKEPNYLYSDLRAMRSPLAGTVARGDLQEDDRYFRGYEPGTLPPAPNPTQVSRGDSAGPGIPGGPREDSGFQDPAPVVPVPAVVAPAEPVWVTQFPPPFEVTEKTIRRGKQRFEIYCSACHGFDGNGQGLVNQRAMALNATGQAQWTTAKSLHDPAVKTQAVGRLFDTITHGRSTMGPYGSQIPVEDRWAIVLYVKALQATGIEPPAGVPAAGVPPAGVPAAGIPAAGIPAGAGTAPPAAVTQ